MSHKDYTQSKCTIKQHHFSQSENRRYEGVGQYDLGGHGHSAEVTEGLNEKEFSDYAHAGEGLFRNTEYQKEYPRVSAIERLNTAYLKVLPKLNDDNWYELQFQDSLERNEIWGIFPHEVAPENLAGAMVMSRSKDCFELLYLAVGQSYQRQGYARKLIAHLLRQADEDEVDRIFLEVNTNNEPAIALYRSFGFENNRLRRDYYYREGQWHDAWEMMLSLKQTGRITD